MKISRNLKLFTGINLISTLLFFTFLKEGILIQQVEGEPNAYVTSLPVLYGVIWLLSSVFCYGTDSARKSRQNLGFSYHIASTVVVFTGMVFGFAIFGGDANSQGFRTIEFLAYPAIAMGLSLLVHWFATRKSPKGIDKKEAFK
jgi:hypothetical protein